MFFTRFFDTKSFSFIFQVGPKAPTGWYERKGPPEGPHTGRADFHLHLHIFYLFFIAFFTILPQMWDRRPPRRWGRGGALGYPRGGRSAMAPVLTAAQCSLTSLTTRTARPTAPTGLPLRQKNCSILIFSFSFLWEFVFQVGPNAPRMWGRERPKSPSAQLFFKGGQLLGADVPSGGFFYCSLSFLGELDHSRGLEGFPTPKKNV